MRAQSTGKNTKDLPGVQSRGFATLEVLVAFSVLILCITAVILLVFGNQSVSVDSQTNNEALYKAQKMLEQARALSRQDFLSVVSTTTTSISIIPYTQTLTVSDLTQCKKQAMSTVTWNSSNRPQKIEMSTFFSDIVEALALGGDCGVDPPISSWNNPANFT